MAKIEPMKILFVAATAPEAKVLGRNRSLSDEDYYLNGGLRIYPLVTGIGSVATIWSIVQWIKKYGKPDLAINAGIGGSFNSDIKNGDVVMPVSECFADLGIDDNNSFRTLFEAGLSNPDEFPFTGGFLISDPKIINKFSPILNSVKSITVNTASGSDAAIRRLRTKYNADIETMEGASFFYICRQESIPFVAVRSISNMIEPRRRDNWNIGLALDNLAAKLDEVFLILESDK